MFVIFPDIWKSTCIIRLRKKDQVAIICQNVERLDGDINQKDLGVNSYPGNFRDKERFVQAAFTKQTSSDLNKISQ